jgi:GxxExxY protein
MGLYPHKTNAISNAVIGCAIEVHKALGPGLLESAYQPCLRRELRLRSIQYASEVALPVCYKGEPLDCGYRLDLVVAGCLIVEVKSVEQLLPIHKAQLLTYLRLASISAGLVINFNVSSLRHGVRRLLLTEISAPSAPPCERTN